METILKKAGFKYQKQTPGESWTWWILKVKNTPPPTPEKCCNNGKY